MFGKGAKRKLDEDEEVLEGKALEGGGLGLGLGGPGGPGPGPGPGGPGPGPVPEGLSRVSYTLQRQTIFNISVMKLYGGRSLVESLQRRVLINNVLRRIQDELRADGSPRGAAAAATPPLSPPPDDPMDEGYREAPPTFTGLAPTPTPSALLMPAIIVPPSSPSPPVIVPPSPPPSPHPRVELSPAPSVAPRVELSPAPMDAGLTPASLLEDLAFCSPPTPPLSPKGTPSVGGGSSAAIRPITRTAVAMTTLPAPPRDFRKADAETPPDVSSPSAGFLSDLALDDVLFADIDTSMYDFDACSAAAATGGGANAVAAATGGGAKLSPAADDLLKSLAAPYTSSAPQVSAANQTFKIDLTELDHIMEVLVGS